MADFSPTGYWAVYLLTDDFHREVVSKVREDGDTGPVARIERLPVVTWSPSGEAAVFDHHGKLTAVGDLYPASCAEFYVTAESPRKSGR